MTPQQLEKSIYVKSIEGQLTLQDVKDLSVFVFLEKEKIKSFNSDYPYSIPKNWALVRLGDIVNIETGKKDANFGSPNGNYNFYTCALIPIKSKTYSYDGDYLILPGNGANVGEAIHYIGKFEAYQRTYLLSKKTNFIDFNYLHILLKAYWKDFNANKQFGSAIPYIKLGNLTNFPVPLPPLEEQKRIVAKIEELLPLISKYETAWTKLEKFNSDFPIKMEKSIIQYALQGKLVKQQSGVESGKELLERITKIKSSINSKKKIQQINSNDVPFAIPKTWVWTRLGQIIDYKMGKTPPRGEPEWWGRDIHWVSIADMTEYGHIKKTKEFVSSKAFKEKFKGNISKKGTLLMSFKLTVGRVSILDVDAVHNEAIISIYPIINDGNIMKMYLFYVLPFLTSFGETKDAIKGRTLNDTSIRNLLIPLPPLEEQKRIVARIEELLPLCKQLIKK